MPNVFSARKQFEVFDPVVRAIMVFVMNMLGLFKRSAEKIGHYVPMFLGIGLISPMFGHWMSRDVNQDVPAIRDSSALPIRRSRATVISRPAFNGAIGNSWVGFYESLFAEFAHFNRRLLETIPNGTVLIDSPERLISSICRDLPAGRDFFKLHEKYCTSDTERMSKC